MEKAGGIHRPFFVLAAFLSVELPLPNRLTAGEKTLRLVIAVTRTASRRLVRSTRMVSAVGKSIRGSTAAKVKIWVTRIADRPFAYAIGQRQNCRAGHIFQFHVAFRHFDMTLRRGSNCYALRRSLLDTRPARRSRPSDACRAVLDRRRTTGQAKAMRLTDYRVSSYSTKVRGNLACAKPVMP